jgi:Cu2+-exporting ATPase
MIHATSDHHASDPGDHSRPQADHEAHVDHSGHERMFRDRFWVCLALSIPVLLYSPMIQHWLGFTPPAFPGSAWIAPLFSVIIFAYGGLPFLRMAGPELRQRRPGMMTLISLAISVSFVFSLATLAGNPEDAFFWELVTLIDIMLLGHWLEMRSIRQASGALDELAKLMPDTAERLRADGGIETVAVDDLALGDLVLVRPGARVPADGRVVEGESSLDEAMITGESRPLAKAPGDRVIAGTTNGEGSLRVEVTATGDATSLAGIMRLVRDAQASKSPTQLLADRAAAVLFYAALAVAALTAIAWTAVVGPGAEVVTRVVTVLVISCPHALGLAVPLVVAITTSLAARNGILVRDRLALEEARNIDIVVFDKTGTLTKGEQGVVDLAVVEPWSAEDALALAVAVEGDSEHAVAKAFRRAGEERNVAEVAVTGFEALKGRGAKATAGGKTVHIGGPRLLGELGIAPSASITDFAAAAGARGHTVVYLIHEGAAVAAFALADVIRPESGAAIERLHALGIEVAMLTGDSEDVAKSVATELGIDTYFAQVLPEHKDQKIAELQARGKRVAMVGDGVNDAPALTRADVGIAIGGGTDVAIESADIVLVRSNPEDVVRIFGLSHASYRKMRENLLWASGYNIVALPLAAGILAPWGILLSPAVGALLMSLSTVIVAVNAQLLRRAQI